MWHLGGVERFAGVDVGGRRKGFDVALVEGGRVTGLFARQSREEVVSVLAAVRPLVVGIDSPCECAPAGERSRSGERRLAREVCPIFYTPDEATVRSGNPFYGWVVEGLELYSAVAGRLPETRCVEVFPSAAWTVWAGSRGGRAKARWSRAALAATGTGGIPARTSQDARDAIGAALVAREEWLGTCVDYGGIRVPQAGSVAFRP